MAWLSMPVLGECGPRERAMAQPGAERDAPEWELGDQGVLWLCLCDLGQVTSIVFELHLHCLMKWPLWLLQQSWVLTRLRLLRC